MHRGLIGIGLKKWPNQAAFIPFRVRNNKFVKNSWNKEIWALSGLILVKNLKAVFRLGVFN